MIALCQENGVPEPIFSEQSGGILVQFKFRNSISSWKNKVEDENLKHISERQKKIMEILNEFPKLSLREIKEKLGAVVASRTIGDDLSFLKQKKLIDYEGVGRGAKWFKFKL